jgi:hypothetical protein
MTQYPSLMHMRTIVPVAVLALVAGGPMARAMQDSRTSDSLERAFVPNGRIVMDLAAGEYRISGSQENRIRLEWSVQDPEQLRKVRAYAEVNGTNARLTTYGPKNHFKVAIQVPARTDLHLRLTAGELRVENIQGNKDIASHAGEIDIDVGRPEEYHLVQASIWAGEIHAAPYHVTKEGLFRSFDWKGQGPYRLHARLKAGELRLHSKLPAER